MIIYVGKRAEHECFALPILDLAVDRQRLLIALDCFIEAGDHRVRITQISEGQGLGLPIFQFAVDRQRLLQVLNAFLEAEQSPVGQRQIVECSPFATATLQLT